MTLTACQTGKHDVHYVAVTTGALRGRPTAARKRA
jgi:hypothetical protein